MMNKRDWRVKPHTGWLSVLLILLYSYTDDVRVAIGGVSCARPIQSSHAYQFILDHGDVRTSWIEVFYCFFKKLFKKKLMFLNYFIDVKNKFLKTINIIFIYFK